MTQIKKILVAYDFSEHSKKALKDAVDLARKYGADLSAVHVLNQDIASVYVVPLKAEYEEDIVNQFHKEYHETHGGSGVDLKKEDVFVEKGLPRVSIIEKAEEINADLIVMGAHGHSDVTLVLMGSVANQVVRHSHVPVLVSRIERDVVKKKILIPVGDSEVSEHAIEYAKKFAGRLDLEIQLMTVVDLTDFKYYMDYKQILTTQLEKATTRLAGLKEKHGISTEPIVAEGKAAHTILEKIKSDEGIGLVVMMSHGRKGLKRAFLGSVAESVMRHAPCSVLTMHHEELHAGIKKRFKEEADEEKKVKLTNIIL